MANSLRWGLRFARTGEVHMAVTVNGEVAMIPADIMGDMAADMLAASAMSIVCEKLTQYLVAELEYAPERALAVSSRFLQHALKGDGDGGDNEDSGEARG